MLTAGRRALLVRSTWPLLAGGSSLAPVPVLSLALWPRPDTAWHTGRLVGSPVLAGSLLA
ncbi:hypothetical protein ATK86_3383 [Nocardia fluminea]|uniref:Uncharacterized protein n=1 Tax=Nocardia fluminea TaxID=134984 RepID=A0A2N3VBJ4_9NOCA|nr:hypothetical protein ATK86_3383 [Nocardia fluminea]